MFCIAVLCGAAGHSNRGFAEPQGGGRKAELSLEVGPQTVGPPFLAQHARFRFLARQAWLECRAVPAGACVSQPDDK